MTPWGCRSSPLEGQGGCADGQAVQGEQAALGEEVPFAGVEDPARERVGAAAWGLSAVSCYRPLRAFRNRAGGDVRIGWNVGTEDAFEVPCGKCVGCRLDRAQAWSVRIMHEAQLYDANVCATLTYDDEHLPSSLSLEYRDVQLFLKRLRKRVCGVSKGPDGRKPVRFFVCGEYGGENGRPHYHAILFNCWFGDQQRVGRYYRSDLCEDIWDRGRVVLDCVTPAVAAYVAGYVLHKAARADLLDSVVDRSTGEVSDRCPEFVQMSRRPGIGAGWYSRFSRDLFSGDFAVTEGRKSKVPRYYSEKYFRDGDPLQVEELREARYQRARSQLGESTEERRAVREAVARARVRFFQSRSL